MPLTKSEVMYFGIGLAIGAAAGANWPKIRKVVAPMLNAASDGMGEAYADVAAKIARMVERAEDSAAVRKRAAARKKPKRRSRARRTTTDFERITGLTSRH